MNIETQWEPVTIGPVTVLSPGAEPPARVEWPSGYPGPGYEADVVYKGRTYRHKFCTDGKTMKVEVVFPDGTEYMFKSPNAASDGMVLFDRKLPLDTSAYVKKHTHKISYPATKALKLKAFSPHFLNLETSKEVTEDKLEKAKEGSFIELELAKKRLIFVKKPETWIGSVLHTELDTEDRLPVNPATVMKYLDETKSEEGTARVRIL